MSLDAEAIDRQAYGKWQDIYNTLGIPVGDGSHKGCPLCGDGNNAHRFRMDGATSNGKWICTQCGAGTGLSMVQKYFNIAFPEALEKVNEIVGDCEVRKPEPKPDPSIALNKVWKASVPLVGSDPVSKYLRNRGLLFHPDALRYCAECWNSDTKQNMPAMIAMLANHKGAPVTIHRTYLTMDGEKADVPKPKKLMPGKEHLAGCAIRLFPPVNGWIGVAEGIETAISCHQMFDAPCWAVTGTSLMESFSPPDGVKKISIYADKDANFSGEKAAYTLAKRLYLDDYIVEVVVPDEIGDFNDILAK